MAILSIRLPEVKTSCECRPTACPTCGATTLAGWGRQQRRIRDPQVSEVEVRRYRCTECQKTFRQHPAGVSRAEQSDRMKVLAALTWGLGLSLRATTGLLGVFQLVLCHETVRQDGLAVAQELRLRRLRRQGRCPVVGVDGSGSRVAGQSEGVVVLVDMGTGQPIELAVVDEYDTEAMVSWLAPLVERYRAEVIVTDDLAIYDEVAKVLDLDHQRCLFHMKRRVGRRLRGFRDSLGEDWQADIDRVEEIVDQLPRDGGYRLNDIYNRIKAPPPKEGQEATPLYKFRRMIGMLSDRWHEYLLYQRRPDVPTTNNNCEYSYNRYKTRTRTMRGVKSSAGRSAIFELVHAAWLA